MVVGARTRPESHGKPSPPVEATSRSERDLDLALELQSAPLNRARQHPGSKLLLVGNQLLDDVEPHSLLKRTDGNRPYPGQISRKQQLGGGVWVDAERGALRFVVMVIILEGRSPPGTGRSNPVLSLKVHSQVGKKKEVRVAHVRGRAAGKLQLKSGGQPQIFRMPGNPPVGVGEGIAKTKDHLVFL